MPVPFSVISSVADFEAVFAVAAGERPRDAFLLCYETPDDNVTADGLAAFRTAVDAAAAEHGARVSLYLWNCGGGFAEARAQLQKEKGSPLLLIVYRGAIADTVRGAALDQIASEDVPRVCARLAAFQRSSKPAAVVPAPSSSSSPSPTTASTSPAVLRVDVARIMALGRDLLGRGEPAYAEKAFVKALDALRAVEAEVRSGSSSNSSQDDFDGSMAMALAWAGLAQLVQGKALNDNAHLRELTGSSGRFAAFCAEPLSDACRVVTTQQLMAAAPRTWTGETCSQKRLSGALQADPTDHDSRAMLVITLFLAGDLERALTEAVKLKVMGADYGRVALKKIVAFLGPDHVLVQQLGPLTAS